MINLKHYEQHYTEDVPWPGTIVLLIMNINLIVPRNNPSHPHQLPWCQYQFTFSSLEVPPIQWKIAVPIQERSSWPVLNSKKKEKKEKKEGWYQMTSTTNWFLW